MVRPQLNAEELCVPFRPREPKVVGRNNADFPSGSLEWSPPPAPPLSTLFLDLGAFPVGTQYLTNAVVRVQRPGGDAGLARCDCHSHDLPALSRGIRVLRVHCLGAPESCVHCHPLLF